MNKQDSRFIAAEKRIKNAFYDILSRKTIEEIRTQEIIASAGINKSTFYSHYRDKYDLLDSIGSDAAEILYPELETVFDVLFDSGSSADELNSAYRSFSSAILQNEKLFRIVLSNISASVLASNISDLIEKIWADRKIADPEVIYYSYLINAITYIIVGTTEKWVKRGCVDPPEDIIRLTYDVGVGVQHALIRIRSSKD